jgi:hypothetical protein
MLSIFGRSRSEERISFKRFIEDITHTCSIRLNCWNVFESCYSVVRLQIPTNHTKFLYVEHFSKTCIWNKYLSVDTIFQSLWFLSGFRDRGLLLTRKLLSQMFLLFMLKSSLRKRYGRFMIWLTAMEYLCHKWPRICSICRKRCPVLI